MTNPNRVIANMPKNPWHIVSEHRSESEAEAVADRLKAEGKKTRITSVRGWKSRTYRVWTVPLEIGLNWTWDGHMEARLKKDWGKVEAEVPSVVVDKAGQLVRTTLPQDGTDFRDLFDAASNAMKEVKR